MEYQILLFIAAFIFLLGLSAFFSGSETAFFSLSKSVLEKLRNSEKRSEKRIAALLHKPRQFLITILVGNTVVNITIASIAAMVTTILAKRFQFNQEIAILIDIVLVTMIILITSEIVPKVLAVHHPQLYARRSSAPLTALFHLLAFIAYPLARFTKWIQKTTGFSKERIFSSELHPEGYFKALAELGEEHEYLETDEKKMFYSIFEFRETTVKEIMIPRTDMVCIEITATLTSLMDLVKTKLLSRIPVYQERIDNITGILYVKDLLPLLSKRRRDKFDLKKLARDPYFIPEQKKIDDLLREFQKERIHMALVVDEYGGISGLVTLEDIIEEIVGEIQDEHDKEAPLYRKLDENTFLVDGRMSLEEVNDELSLELPTEEGVETISGFILNLLGSLPKEKETTHYKSYTFVVERISRNRILQVRVHKKASNRNVGNEALK